jgi:putative hydrolase of the HAD superfamily
VRTFERGGCSPEDFAAGVVREWDLPVAPEDFLAAFLSWPGAPLPGADALLGDVQLTVAVGCLSNTNALHWNHHSTRWPLLGAFDFRFLSFELGIVKPDREVFERVAGLLPAPPDRVLFLDDNAVNVDGAASAGFVARRVRGVGEARQALVAARVLAA